MSKRVFEYDFLGKKLIVETGEYAKQANASVLVRYGDTVILTAVVMGNTPITQDFFPLTLLFFLVALFLSRILHQERHIYCFE